MAADFDLGGGVLVPTLFLWAAIALLLGAILRRILAAIGFYRLVWHRALFDLAMTICLLGGVMTVVTRLGGL